MVKIRPHYQNGEGPVRWFRGKIQRIEEGQEQAVAEAVDRGADLMRTYIETRGTAKSGKQGRIETGKMLDAVEVRPPAKDTAGKTQAFFGWLSTREDYFRYQEGGFQHTSGANVEGMYALTDAAEETFRQLKVDMERNIRGA